MKTVLVLASATALTLALGSGAGAKPTKPASATIVPPGSIAINGAVATPRTLKFSEVPDRSGTASRRPG
jgi:hypothetical protein